MKTVGTGTTSTPRKLESDPRVHAPGTLSVHPVNVTSTSLPASYHADPRKFCRMDALKYPSFNPRSPVFAAVTSSHTLPDKTSSGLTLGTE